MCVLTTLSTLLAGADNCMGGRTLLRLLVVRAKILHAELARLEEDLEEEEGDCLSAMLERLVADMEAWLLAIQTKKAIKGAPRTAPHVDAEFRPLPDCWRAYVTPRTLKSRLLGAWPEALGRADLALAALIAAAAARRATLATRSLRSPEATAA